MNVSNNRISNNQGKLEGMEGILSTLFPMISDRSCDDRNDEFAL